MSRLDSETKRKLREMGVTSLVDALEVQDDTLTLGMVFEERVKLVVDDALATFTHSKVEGLIRRAGLRYPNADLRRLDMILLPAGRRRRRRERHRCGKRRTDNLLHEITPHIPQRWRMGGTNCCNLSRYG